MIRGVAKLPVLLLIRYILLTLIDKLNKAFENRVRLGLMSILIVNEKVDFITAKELLRVTDGNLSSHTNSLENLGYISVKKAFAGKKTKTTYRVTISGRTAFKKHIDALEVLIKGDN